MNRAFHLSVKQLRVFAALLKDGNLSRVAEDMGMTQQAVSANLGSLRDVFGDPLFLRTGRGVTPTDFAAALGEEIDAILAAMEQLVDRAPFNPAEVQATLTVSAADYAHAVAITPWLAEIRRQAPGLKLVLTELEVDALATRMAVGEIDLVVSIPDYVPPHFPRQRLFSETYVCVVSKDSPLAGTRLDRKALAAEPQVVVSPRRANLVGSADDWFKQGGAQRNIILSAPHFLLAPEMIARTGAIGFLPSRLTPHERLSTIELVDDAGPTGFDVIAAWHPRSEHNPLINWFVSNLITEPAPSS